MGSAVAAARDMLALIDGFSQERAAAGKAGIRIGIGIATGEVVTPIDMDRLRYLDEVGNAGETSPVKAPLSSQ